MDLKLVVRALWDRISGWALIALGALALLLGWHGVLLDRGRKLSLAVFVALLTYLWVS